MTQEVQHIPPSRRHVRWVVALSARWPIGLIGLVMTIYGATKGWIDDYPVSRALEWQDDFLTFMDEKHPTVGERIVSTGKLGDDVVADLDAALAEHKERFAN